MKITISVTAILAIIVCNHPAFADSWALPQPTKIYSANKQYYLEVIPRTLESQLKFFDDKSKGIEPAGSPKGLRDNYCKGILYKRAANGNYARVWEQRLSNEVSPVAVLVADNGEYVVTFDNWHAIGYGDNVVAIYDEGGKLIRKMSLSDLLPLNEILKLPRSVSSVCWGGEHEIDEEKGHLVLEVVSELIGTIEDKPKYKKVRINLKTGQLLPSA